jgi:hypothetical protein
MSLEFSWIDGGNSYDQTYNFTSLSAADAFLTDDVLDLGLVTDPALTFDLTYTLNAQDVGDYDFDFLVGLGSAQSSPDSSPTDTPEPASGALLLTAGAGLAGLRRSLGKRRWLGARR